MDNMWVMVCVLNIHFGEDKIKSVLIDSKR